MISLVSKFRFIINTVNNVNIINRSNTINKIYTSTFRNYSHLSNFNIMYRNGQSRSFSQNTVKNAKKNKNRQKDYKMKTNKSAASRFKVFAKGFIRKHANRNHLNLGTNSRARSRGRKNNYYPKTFRIRKLLVC